MLESRPLLCPEPCPYDGSVVEAVWLYRVPSTCHLMHHSLLAALYCSLTTCCRPQHTLNCTPSVQAQAYNEATFREPDEAGWQPQQEPIDINPGCTLDTCLHTRLELPHIVGEYAMPPQRLFASPERLLACKHYPGMCSNCCKHAAWCRLSCQL